METNYLTVALSSQKTIKVSKLNFINITPSNIIFDFMDKNSKKIPNIF